ncbi:MAG: fructosamine kinase family protein [Acidobacteria bacterium]|nr:fructosamine kinase family protein [Acidobacteriota bacterium]
MIHPELETAFKGSVGLAVNQNLNITPVSGGCIHQAYRLQTERQSWFVKISDATHAAMLETEAQALNVIRSTRTIRTPEVLALDRFDNLVYLVLEWLDLAPLQASSGAELGRCLAEFHQVPVAQFGWDRDNFIGLTPQLNGWYSSWPEFFWEKRLTPQISAARIRGLEIPQEELCHAVMRELTDHHVSPSWLHGDLWGGNAAVTLEGEAVIFDPALYAGDPECDLAMTRLFGGFPTSFYRAYASVHPPTRGADRRQNLYNLYHALNHFNLFGSSYQSMVLQLVRLVI